jgi:hypothetical protein
MGIRQFFRAFRSTKGEKRPSGPEDQLAADVRETMGPQGGADAGEAVYDYIEEHEPHEHRRDDD